MQLAGTRGVGAVDVGELGAGGIGAGGVEQLGYLGEPARKAPYQETDHPIVPTCQPSSTWRWCYVPPARRLSLP